MTIDLVTDSKVDELLFQIDVSYMTNMLFGISYTRLKTLIYPSPLYNSFIINKRNGNPRFIDEPKKELKFLQLKLLEYLTSNIGDFKSSVHGFVENRSIVTNAKAHCSPRTTFVLNLDIEDFFPSITFYRVRGLFKSHPFGFSHHVATVLAQLCTFNGKLPQGAPTSPFISNLICRSLDADLVKLARKYKANYTRYADDISISFTSKDTTKLPPGICSSIAGDIVLGAELTSIISSHSFKINSAKTRLSSNDERQEITGLVINEFVNVKRNFIDSIRGALHSWEKYGYSLSDVEWQSKALSKESPSNQKRLWRRQTRVGKNPELKTYLWGKLLFLKMVRGADDIIYAKLAKRFNAVVEREKNLGSFACPSLPIDMAVRTKENAKDAVFLVEWMADYKIPGSSSVEMIGAQGTAFAYKKHGLITCSHVLTFSGHLAGEHALKHIPFDSPDLINFSLTLTNALTKKPYKAKVIRRDEDHDIAVLVLDTPEKVKHHYFLSSPDPVIEGQNGWLIGFPNYSTAKPVNFLNSAVLTPFTRVLARFDLTTVIRTGNSGGPFVNDDYLVVGMAQQGATQNSGNNECLTIKEVDSWLQKI